MGADRDSCCMRSNPPKHRPCLPDGLQAMFNTVKKKLRDGPGPNSYKQDADILDDYYNNGDGELGSLGGELGGLGGSLGDSSMPGGLSVNFDTELFQRKDDGGGSSSIFGMVSRRK